MIHFNCPHCDKAIKTADGAAGKKNHCPNCGAAIVVPRTSSLTIQIEPPSAARQPKARRAVAPTPSADPQSAPPKQNLSLLAVGFGSVAVVALGIVLLVAMQFTGNKKGNSDIGKPTGQSVADNSNKPAALANIPNVLPTGRPAPASAPATAATNDPNRPRLVDWGKCFDTAVGTPWGAGLRPIPATVIDKGTLRYVPYKSFNAGDYEVNVYGDPDQPAGIEIGVRGEALNNPAARANCLAYMARVLTAERDRAVLNTLKLAEDLTKHAGLTFEVTPPTAEDAYGGWWVSVYDEGELNRCRVSPKDLAAITVPRKDIADTAPTTTPGNLPQWSKDDLSRARPGKDVYVHSYTRKDGTFVQGHTRSAPGTASGGRRK